MTLIVPRVTRNWFKRIYFNLLNTKKHLEIHQAILNFIFSSKLSKISSFHPSYSKFHLFILLLGRNFIFSSKPFKISSFHPLLGRNFIFSSMSQSNLGRNFIFSSTSHLIQMGEISSFHPSFSRPNFIFSPKIWLGRNFIQIWTSQ